MTVLDPIVGAKYLQEHGIPMLIEDILRELLTEKPSAPLPFIKGILNRAEGGDSGKPAAPASSDVGELQAKCAALEKQVAELQAQIIEGGKKHADHTASVRKMMADVAKTEMIELGAKHAEHTSSVRSMMADVCKNEVIAVGALHADHTASVRSMMSDVAKNQMIELGAKHADHTASVRAMMKDLIPAA